MMKSDESHKDNDELKRPLFADAGDDGFSFILKYKGEKSKKIEEDTSHDKGGLIRKHGDGHFVTIAGKGGTGKSIFALQILTNLLEATEEQDPVKGVPISSSSPSEKKKSWENRPHTAFYFTLEAAPSELADQVRSFFWGENIFNYENEHEQSAQKIVLCGVNQGDTKNVKNITKQLQIISIPSPSENINALYQIILQTIASELKKIAQVVAIAIDPLGGVTLGDDLRGDLSQLKYLAESHRTYLFLLTEDYIFRKYRSIEHYSQSIIHLEHEPSANPTRRLYIQKARSQSFLSGYHKFELEEKYGARVYPSIQAQSAYAHDQKIKSQSKDTISFLELPLSGNKETEYFKALSGMPKGSVIFLMGPPGTFKQTIATAFSMNDRNGASIYISFKVDGDTVSRTINSINDSCNYHLDGNFELHEREVLQLELDFIHSKNKLKEKIRNGATSFIDVRSPLSTPEVILSLVRIAIKESIKHSDGFQRAVIWGLRRLSDLPNFSGSNSVQFLEALVTILKQNRVTSLLVDWPDVEKANPLPIVDLCQYILLTRMYKSKFSLEDINKQVTNPIDENANNNVHYDNTIKTIDEFSHAAFLRVQRTAKGFGRNDGVILGRKNDKFTMSETCSFEKLWHRNGSPWEQDFSLRY